MFPDCVRIMARQEARSSWETHSDAQNFQETGCIIEDYRVLGISLSTIQQQENKDNMQLPS